ncbi:APUM5 [Symbiodinium sp. CCMP2592]|nr:APUM5 [Symbiodinium sp. CCMP2592]
MQQPIKELPVAPTLLKFLPPPGFEHFAQKTLTANARSGESHRCSRNGAEQPDRGGQTSPSDTGLISSAACPEAAGTDIADYIVKIIRTEAGAEGMVQCLASASSLGLAVAVAAVLPELPELACDAHASKVLIALLEHCRDVSQYRVRLVQRLRGHLLKLTKDKTGCVVMQRMLDVAAVELQSCLPLELRGKVLACSQHLHGNFVLQRCVEVFPPESLSFLILELKGHAASVATHIYACRILQRLVERCPSHPEMPELLQSILQPMDQLERLCKDPYGNNVIRSLLLRGSGTAARFVINAISTDVLKFSRNRHSSLVVERCIMVSSDERQEEFGCERAALMGALLLDGSGGSNPAFAQLMLDRFGNYIAQRVIECCQGTEALRVEQLLHRSWAKLQNSSNGRHIIAAARKRFGGGEMVATISL